MEIKQTLVNWSKLIVKSCLVFCFISAVGLDDYFNAAYFDEFNPSPRDFNTNQDHVGFDSGGNDNPNALQFSGGASVSETPIYDNYGNQLVADGVPVVTEAAQVGYYNGNHNGKIHAGAIAKININGVARDCIYLNAVDIQGSGTFSGWVRVDRMSPSSTVWNISEEIHERRENVRYTSNPNGNSRYEYMEVVNQSVPSSMEDGYIIPNRTSNAGKVTYYYIRDGLLNGFVNLPETGNKRHGVQSSRVKPGAPFWRDKDVDNYIQNIYGYDSSNIIGTFRWCYGYFETNAGTKIYCWVNRECLVAQENTSGSTIVQITKRNATGFAIDGNHGGENGQNVYLWSENQSNVNQQWIEIDRGNGYYSYQKQGTNYCVDGNNGGADKQNVYLWTCSANNQNQHWQKVDVGGGAYKLVKRNASGFALDGGSGGANGNNVKLYNSSVNSQNLHWFITPIGTSAKSVENKTLNNNTAIIYPNPVVSTTTIQGALNSIVRVYDITGSLLFTKDIVTEQQQIDLSTLATGVYYAHIEGQQSVSVIKIIKE